MKTLIVVLLSTLKLLQKSERSTENRITFPDALKNPSAFPVTIGTTVLLTSSINLMFFWTRTFHGTWFQQLLCKYNQYPQPTTHQPTTDSYPVFSSLRRMDSQSKGLRVSFAFFRQIYLPDGRENETFAAVEELSDLWKPGAMDGIPPFVMNCNCI